MAVGLPKKFLDEEVAVELVAEFPLVSGRITQFTENHIVLEGESKFYLIPWTAIVYLWIPKKKEPSK